MPVRAELSTRDELRSPLIAAALSVQYAYQPIVSASSLRVHGFEALARCPSDSAFRNINDLLDAAHEKGELRAIERFLIRKAMAKFSRFGAASTTQLFCNVDNRVFDDALLRPAALVEMASDCGLNAGNICLELSERQPPQNFDVFTGHIKTLLDLNIRVAIDDFGNGFSGLHMFMAIDPHYVKVDKLFIDGIGSSHRQQAIVAKLNGLAHALGFLTIAEGVENESDFRMARDLGCDLIQGYLIAKPSTDLSMLRLLYDNIGVSASAIRISPKVEEMADLSKPIALDDPLSFAIERFKQQPDLSLIAVVDPKGHVQGAIYEEDVRHYLLSDFGPALLMNRGLGNTVTKLLRRCPVLEATSSITTIVESYINSTSCHGVVLTSDGIYIGYLNNHAIIKLANDGDVEIARDQNPLTYLPGNNSIIRHITETLRSTEPRTYAIFDFDNFKPFNDAFGFQVGDKALLMFAELLREIASTSNAFCGHVGGDDFFLSLEVPSIQGEQIIRNLMSTFSERAEKFYSADARRLGGINGVDRFGQARFFPMLSVSAAMVPAPIARSNLSSETITDALAGAKAAAKSALDRFAILPLVTSGIAELQERVRRWTNEP